VSATSSEHDPPLTLPIYEGWHTDRLRPWTYGMLFFGAGLGVALSLLLHSPVPLLLVAVGTIGGAIFEVPYTRTRRFGAGSRQTITARREGLEGDAFPPSRYTRLNRVNSGGAANVENSFVVRTRLTRQIAERAERPNFVSWSRSTIVVYCQGGVALAIFWGQTPPADNSVFHGLVLTIPEPSLPRFVQLATVGGADLHISADLLSQRGLNSTVACFNHRAKSRWTNFPVAMPRLGASESYSDYVAWIRRAQGRSSEV
jgi:hypothetical protein